MDSDQRRKRKRIAKPLHHLYLSLPPHYFSVRFLALCFTFITFLSLLSNRIPNFHLAFRPVLVVPSIPLLSSSSINSNELYRYNELSSSQLRIEDRILFPDHVLLLVSNRNVHRDEFECVYYENSLNNRTGNSFDEIVGVNRNVLWVDDYNQFQLAVRCPLPPANFSGLVNLEVKRGKVIRYVTGKDEELGRNRTVHSWETVVYEAVLDGNTAVVFVKGLKLRPDRESDPTMFRCHFGLGNWEREGRYVLTVKAITAAQEVVRCLLPRSIQMNPSKAKGTRVTIGLTPHVHGRAKKHVIVPSVAKIMDFKSEERVMKKSEGKYELCACTMVWNQASALREWILYHAWLGVERLFVYDNNSDDGIKEVIEELQKEGYNVSRHVWPWIKSQEAGFSHCALRARNECQWVGFMDVDEFFYFPNPNPHNQKELGFPSQNSLRTLITNLSTSPTVAEIRTACHSFGPSGLTSTPSQGVTVGYTCRLQSPERHKSIVRPDALDITLLNAVHHFHLKKGFEYLNLPQSIGVINHYKYQVWESFRAKFFRRVATYVADWQEIQNEGSRDRAPGLGREAIEPPNWPLQFCEVWDTGLRDFVLGNFADLQTGLLPWERTSL